MHKNYTPEESALHVGSTRQHQPAEQQLQLHPVRPAGTLFQETAGVTLQ